MSESTMTPSRRASTHAVKHPMRRPAPLGGVPAAPAASPLGTIAKFSTGDTVGSQVDAILTQQSSAVDTQKQRRYRYFLQEQASRLLRKFAKEREDAEGHIYVDRMKTGEEKTKFKVCMCGRVTLRPGVARVHKTTKSATFKNMVTCGSVWTCPVCSAVVSVRRRKEIVIAVDGAKDEGLMVFMMTLTARHSSATRLSQFYEAMSEAHGRLWSGGDIKTLKLQFGVAGMISNREITFSPINGPHPHIHELVFLKRPELSQEQVNGIKEEIAESVLRYRSTQRRIQFYEERLAKALARAQQEAEEKVVKAFDQAFRARWERVAADEGLDMDEHGFDVSNASSRVAEYVSKFGHEPKWREADELTKWHRKTANKGDSFTPWQLLELASQGDAWAEAMFQDYALVFFGKKQVHWSKGLKTRFGIKEKTDQELANETSEEAKLVFVIDAPYADFFETVVAEHKRAEYLELCELETKEAIIAAVFARFGFKPEVYEHVEDVGEPEEALAS